MIENGTGTGDTEDSAHYYIGEKILASGKIEATKTFTTFTHHFITNKGETFGLKSKNIDLYTFSWQVQLKGEITDFKNDLAIINVSEIIDGDKILDEDNEETNQTGGGNADYYAFKNDGIGFDLSISEGYTVEKQWDEIMLIDLQSENQPKTVLTISPFACTPGDGLKDCSVLKKRLENANSESFVSGPWIKFYHLSETTTRVSFNDNIHYGYYLSPNNENNFATFANLMSMLDESTIKNAIEKKLTNICKNIDYTMTSIDDISYDRQENASVIAHLKSIADDNSKMTCKVNVRLGNTLEVSKLSFAVDTSDKTNEEEWEKENNNDEDHEGLTEGGPDSIEGKDPIAPPTIDLGIDETILNDWFAYHSVRWYSVYFSNKNISYAGQILDTSTDLNIEWIKCPYKINVVTWKNAEQVDIDPSVEIYECRWEVSEDDLASQKLQKVGIVEDVIFLAKWYNDPWKNMDIIIKEPQNTDEE